MKTRLFWALILGVSILAPRGFADDKNDDTKNGKKEETRRDYAELSKFIQQAVVEKAPKRFEDRSGWGRTIPAPPVVRFPRLRRAVIQDGDKLLVPDGVWKRSLVWLDDPAKDIKIEVRDLKQTAPKQYRVQLDATVALHAEGERRRWRNGVQLFGIVVQADATITASLTCDVKLGLDSSKFPPDVTVEPKVVESKLLLQKFDLNRVGNVLVGDPARDLGDDLKDFIQELMRQREGEVKEAANEAIAKALKDGKARISAASLLNLTNGTKPKQ